MKSAIPSASLASSDGTSRICDLFLDVGDDVVQELEQILRNSFSVRPVTSQEIAGQNPA